MSISDQTDPVDRKQVISIVVARLLIAKDFLNVRTRDDWERMTTEILGKIRELPNVCECPQDV